MLKINSKMRKRGQVWVETVIYTLIGLVIIATLLAIANPQIEKIKDRGIIEHTVNALNILDNKILEIEQSPGNIRIIEFKIGKGKLEINPSQNELKYVLENTNLKLSEPGKEIKEGKIFYKTEKYGGRFNIYLTIKYDNLNISYKNEEKNKILQAGATPYKIKIENMGSNTFDSLTNIDFELI